MQTLVSINRKSLKPLVNLGLALLLCILGTGCGSGVSQQAGSGCEGNGTACQSTLTQQPTGIQLSPGDNIQAAVNTHPTSTTFVLTPGIYRMQIVAPKAGDVFVGESGAILDGAALIDSSSWRQASPSVWVAQVGGISQQASYRGVCDAKHPACIFPEDLFFDSKPLTRVASLSLVAPGTWYLDYGTDKVYVGSDPSGHLAELSVVRAAFWGAVNNVTIKGLSIEKYASIAGRGAITPMAALSGPGPSGKGWVVDSNDLYLNHGAGVHASNGMVISNNKVHDNGQIGVVGSGSDVLIEGNEIYGNNYAGYAYDWEAGGVKISFFCNHVTIRNNYVHDNKGPGIHADIADDDFVIEGNRTARNLVAGIHYEISYHGVIRNNVIEDDGFSPGGTGLMYGAGILISNSSGVEVYGNTVTDCMNGIGGIQLVRGANANTGVPYTLQNLYVHNDIITQQSGYAAGIVKASAYDDSVYTSWGNHFQDNTFNLSTLTYPYFYWLDQKWTYSQWQLYASEH